MECLERCLQQYKDTMKYCYLVIADKCLKVSKRHIPVENKAFQFDLQDESRNSMKSSDHHFGCFL